MVELARLERVYDGNVIEGSNPSLSAKITRLQYLRDSGLQREVSEGTEIKKQPAWFKMVKIVSAAVIIFLAIAEGEANRAWRETGSFDGRWRVIVLLGTLFLIAVGLLLMLLFSNRKDQ